MSIQTQEDHIYKLYKTIKKYEISGSLIFSQAKHGCIHMFTKTENITLTVVFTYSHVI